MAKRGRKKKFKLSFNISPETLRSVVAVALVLFSALALISFVAPDYFINSKIQLVFKKSFGHGSFLIPFITFITGLLFIDALKHSVKELRIIIGLFMLVIALSGFTHLFIPAEEARAAALDGRGGGFVGYIVATGLAAAISVYGSFAVLLAFSVVGLILVFDISIDQAIVFYNERLKTGAIFKKSGADDEIEVTPGMGDPDDELSEFSADSAYAVAAEDTADVIVTEPSFEIVPSMSEPQMGLDDAEILETALDGSAAVVAPNLPYTDKVWELPPLDLLATNTSGPPDTGDVEHSKKIIKETLSSFGIPVEVQAVQIGPSVTKFELAAPPGVKVSKIANLQYDLAMALASPTGSVRIEAPIPGKALIGIEVPNRSRALVDIKSLISSDQMKAMKSKLGIVLGKDVGGGTLTYDIAKMPHLLIAGATGSGKSVFIHNLIFSILFRATPQEVKFIMIDPKRVELKAYEDIPHLYTPLVTDIDKAPSVFKWAVSEMTRRYKLFESARARNIEAYNEKSGFQALPYIVIVVDELAEIMVADPAAVEKSIIRLAQLARATGIHLVLAAQRPSANIITGLIKANIPCRIAFNVAGQVDSRVIIDQSGAEKLLGKGDMLFVPPDKPTPTRLQGAMVTDKEINNVVGFLKGQGMPPEYKEEILNMQAESAKAEKSVAAGGDSTDALYDEAIETVVSAGKASASLLQRRLSIGYARAARILDELEQNGVVGPPKGSKPREVLIEPDKLSDPGAALPEPETEISAPELPDEEI